MGQELWSRAYSSPEIRKWLSKEDLKSASNTCKWCNRIWETPGDSIRVGTIVTGRENVENFGQRRPHLAFCSSEFIPTSGGIPHSTPRSWNDLYGPFQRIALSLSEEEMKSIKWWASRWRKFWDNTSLQRLHSTKGSHQSPLWQEILPSTATDC